MSVKGSRKSHCKRGHELPLVGYCRLCHKIKIDEWRLNHPGWYENKRLQRQYGITSEIVSRMRDEQNNRCAICETEFKDTGKNDTPHVDHVHDESKKVRGLLCHKCNMFIAYAKESTYILQSAVRYLEKFVYAGKGGELLMGCIPNLLVPF